MIWFYGVWTQRKRCNKMITIIIYTLHGRCIRNCWLFPLCHLAMTLFMWMGVCVYWKQQAYTDFYRTLCCTSLWTVDSNDQTETRCQNMHFSFLSLRHTKKNDSNNKRIEEERNENEIETTWHSILETKVNKQIAIVERWLQFCVLSVVATMPTQAVHMYVCVWLSVQESIKHKDNGNVITQPLHVAAVTKQCERIPEPTRILKLKSS